MTYLTDGDSITISKLLDLHSAQGIKELSTNESALAGVKISYNLIAAKSYDVDCGPNNSAYLAPMYTLILCVVIAHKVLLNFRFFLNQRFSKVLCKLII